MKIGLVFNPNSGARRVNKNMMRILSEKLSTHELFCSYASYHILKDFFTVSAAGSQDISGTFKDCINAGRTLSFADAVVSFGGDGTVSDIVSGMRQSGKMVPIIGVGMGTANAGPFITIKTEKQAYGFDFEHLCPRWIEGIDVYEDSIYIGTGFNDVVFSDTLISTVEGNTCTVNAASFWRKGERIISEPGEINTPETVIKINDSVVCPSRKISQIIIGCIDEKHSSLYAYKAYTGLICWSSYTGCTAVMTVCKEPVIKMTSGKGPFSMSFSQSIFSGKDILSISGLKGFCIIDGNPRSDMSRGHKILIKTNTKAALSVQGSEKND